MPTLASLLDVSVVLFAVSSMLSVGLGHSFREIVRPLGNVSRVGRVLVANYVLVPLLAYMIIQTVSLERSLADGLFLIATAAGAPFLIKLSQAAEASLSRSATLLMLLLPVTIIYMPLVVPLALPAADVSVYGIAAPLLLSMLLPLAIGFVLYARARRLAQRLQPLAARLSTIALLFLIVTTIFVNWQGILGIFGTGAILAAMLLIVGAFGIGFVLGGRDVEVQEVFGLGTGQRNISAATVVATQAIGDPDTVTMVVVSSLVGFAILFPIAGRLRRREIQAVARGH